MKFTMTKNLFFAVSFFAASAVYAADVDVNADNHEFDKDAAAVQDQGERSPAAAERSEVEVLPEEGGYRVGVTNFALRPQAGAVFYNDTSRFAGGVMMDFNVLGTPWAKIGP